MEEMNDIHTAENKLAEADHSPSTETSVAVPAAHNVRSVAGLQGTDDVNAIEAPVTWQSYLICAFASFGGIFFGYDSGYINGVTGTPVFVELIEGPGQKVLKSANSSLIVSILSAGTFFGALAAGDVADRIGRKWTVISGCGIYLAGVVIQMCTGAGSGNPLGLLVAGRLLAGIGVGFESAIVILYMSEIVRIYFRLGRS